MVHVANKSGASSRRPHHVRLLVDLIIQKSRSWKTSFQSLPLLSANSYFELSGTGVIAAQANGSTSSTQRTAGISHRRWQQFPSTSMWQLLPCARHLKVRFSSMLLAAWPLHKKECLDLCFARSRLKLHNSMRSTLVQSLCHPDSPRQSGRALCLAQTKWTKDSSNERLGSLTRLLQPCTSVWWHEAIRLRGRISADAVEALTRL